MTGELVRNFGMNAVVIVTLALVLWRVAVRSGDPSFIDTCWGAGFVVVAATTFLLTDSGSARRVTLLAVTALWGLRLASYLFWRWRKNGPDARYVGMLKKADNPARYMLQNVFGLQAGLLLIVSLPVQFGMAYANDDALTPINLVGLALALFGIAFESTGDFQLTRFKADPANHGHVMDKGLWRYTRHPNYFGDFCTWWGIFLLAQANAVTVASVIGPVVMSILLMRYSGVGPLEKQMHRTKPKYKEYVARTSAFFPAPPK